MQRIISKTIITLLFILIPFTLFAAKISSSNDKTYVLRIKSFNSNQPVMLKGSFSLFNGKEFDSSEINQLSPFELVVNTQMIGLIVNVPVDGPLITVQISEKNNEQEFARIYATGHGVIARQSSDGISYVSAN